MRLTALLAPAISSQMNSTSTIEGRTRSRGSRMKEIAFPAGVRCRLSSSHGEIARKPKTSAMTLWPMILARLRRPRLRCRAILM